jgi:hypothetical protein
VPQINNHSHLNFKSAAKILNALTIRGRLFHTSRGKELVIGIDHVCLHYLFVLRYAESLLVYFSHLPSTGGTFIMDTYKPI